MSPALITSIAGLVTAIGGVLAIIMHARGPAHRPPTGGGPPAPGDGAAS